MVEQDGSRILTVPPELTSTTPVVPTANEWIALPDVAPATAALGSITLLHDAAAGLIALVGAPLSRPSCAVDGAGVEDEAWSCTRLADALPRHTTTAAGCELTLTTFCPAGHKGFVQVLEATNTGEASVTVELGMAGALREAELHVFTGRPLAGPHRCAWDDWTGSLVWEAGAGLPVAGLAVRRDDGEPPVGVPAGEEPVGLSRAWAHLRTLELAPGQHGELVLYWGVGREADGAGLAAVHLARLGWRTLLDDTCAHLRARAGPALPGRPQLEAVRNRNRLFCLGFAAGRTIDTEELVLVTSRSPRYYVSGAHWSRDSLLWAFPAVLAVDLDLSGEWLRAAFARYTRNVGLHALYLDGATLYPGFELDEVCAFHLALDAYLQAGGDDGILDQPAVRAGLERVDAALEQARDAATGLLSTFLLATDDPAPLPLVTYDNALAVAALRAAARTQVRRGEADRARRRAAWADEVLAALREHMVVDGPFGPMLCGATDGRGRHELFDEPPGSLELLGHYGVLDADDPLLTATVTWIHSEHNPFGPGVGRYAAPRCAHAGHPWLLAVGNALLRGDGRWLEALPELPLDHGLACESFDADTGEPRTGLGFATCAGWLAHAIDVAVARSASHTTGATP